MSSFSWNVLRPVDLLAVRFEFFDPVLAAEEPNAGCLVRERAGEDAFVVVHFPPQHIAERPDPQPQCAGPVSQAKKRRCSAARLVTTNPVGADAPAFSADKGLPDMPARPRVEGRPTTRRAPRGPVPHVWRGPSSGGSMEVVLYAAPRSREEGWSWPSV